MNMLIIISSLIAVGLAAPAIELLEVTQPDAPSAALTAADKRALPALEYEEVHDEYGQFSLRYVTAEGTLVTQTARLVPTADGLDYVLVYEGEVSYVGDDGEVYVTKYTAGLDGTHVTGNHLPVAPEPVTPAAPVVIEAVKSR